MAWQFDRAILHFGNFVQAEMEKTDSAGKRVGRALKDILEHPIALANREMTLAGLEAALGNLLGYKE